MNRESATLLYAYNQWANERILAAAATLSPRQLSAPRDFGWQSLFGALVHILDAEYYWRVFLAESRETDWIEADDFDGLPALRERWDKEHRALASYIAALSDEAISSPFAYEVEGKSGQRPLWHFLQHVLNHSAQHRSECAAILTGFGASPGDMDLLVFLDERPAATENTRRDHAP